MGLKSDGTVVTTDFFSDFVSQWTDIIAISSNDRHIVGLKSDGTVVATGLTDRTVWNATDLFSESKLFDDFDNLEEERKAKMPEATRLAEEKKRIEKEIASRRSQGLCQHCGGTFKGMFTKKCTNCGKEKDY